MYHPINFKESSIEEGVEGALLVRGKCSLGKEGQGLEEGEGKGRDEASCKLTSASATRRNASGCQLSLLVWKWNMKSVHAHSQHCPLSSIHCEQGGAADAGMLATKQTLSHSAYDKGQAVGPPMLPSAGMLSRRLSKGR